MKRPSDQAKLLLVGLLRTVSALATADTKCGAAAVSTSLSAVAHAHYHSSPHFHHEPPLQPSLTLRLARRTDVPSMQRCNLASLPENYNTGFFTNHLRQYPDLTLVAVDKGGEDEQQRLLSFGSFPNAVAGPPETVVAYVLGKVEERYVHEDPNSGGAVPVVDEQGWPRITTERIGHVTSLAVLESYRRQGLARELMAQLHYHLSAQGVQKVGLHVRRSNRAAVKLYERFGYDAAEVIPRYYHDGEDGYYMMKQLPDLASLQNQQHSYGLPYNNPGFFGSFRRIQQPWETGPEELRLPRWVGSPRREDADANELLTGNTM